MLTLPLHAFVKILGNMSNILLNHFYCLSYSQAIMHLSPLVFYFLNIIYLFIASRAAFLLSR